MNKIGTVLTDNKSTLEVWAKDGRIMIDELQISGKKRLKTEDFLNGFSFKDNQYFL